MNKLRKLLIALNNRITAWRGVRVPVDAILLLLPHCLQQDTCPRKLIHDPEQCERCGRCDMTALLELRQELGVRCHVAGGGREALAQVRNDNVRAVVAVACDKELVDGIRAAFPKPVVAVPLSAPHGYCKNTRADLPAVRKAINHILISRS